jgi:hypothetical protein
MKQIEQKDGAEVLRQVIVCDSSFGEDYHIILIDSIKFTTCLQGVSNNIVQIANCRTFNITPFFSRMRDTNRVEILRGSRVK